MTWTHQGTGTVAIATSDASNPMTCSPGFPGGYSVTAGHFAVITVVSRHDTEATPTITSGWDQEPGMSASGGGGTFGAGTGPARLTWFVRKLQNGDTAPTVSLAGTNTGRTLQAVMTVISTDQSYARFAYAMQAEATAGTSWSEAYTTHLHIKNGDFLFLGYGVRDDQPASSSAQGISATGCTIGTVTERADSFTANGNDAGLVLATASCTANASTANPTVTATIGSSETGMTGVLRARDFTDGTKPTLIDEIATGYNGSASARTSKTFQAKAGDILTVGAGASDDACTVDSISGGSLTWTSQESINVGGSNCSGRLWSAEVDADKSMTVTVNFSPSVNAEFTGQTILQYANADTVGNHTAEAAVETPSMALTTAADHSAIAYYNFDWSAVDGATRTWRTINSITPTANNGLEGFYFRDAAQWTVYAATWDDAGTAGSDTTGLSAPTGQSPTHLAIEIKVAGGQSVNVGQVTETDTAQTISTSVTTAVGQATETDVAQPITGQMALAIGQPSDTETAGVVSSIMATPVGQATETDIAQIVSTGGQSVNVDQALETDTSQVISILQSIGVGIASDTETAQPITTSMSISVGQVVEADTAGALTSLQTVLIGQVVENDTAQTVSTGVQIPVGQVQEADTARAIFAQPTIVRAAEADTALGISFTGGEPPAVGGDLEYISPLWIDILGLRLKRR